MSLADPSPVKISGTTTNLPRVSVGDRKSVYSNPDGTLILTVSHQPTKAGGWRRMARIDASKIAADPFETGASDKVAMSTYVVWDTPADGYTPADVAAVWGGLWDFLTANSSAATTKILGGES